MVIHCILFKPKPFCNCPSFLTASASKRKRGQHCEKRYLAFLRTLVLGSLVTVVLDGQKVDGEVKVVDRFKRTLIVKTADDEKEVHASLLVTPKQSELYAIEQT